MWANAPVASCVSVPSSSDAPWGVPNNTNMKTKSSFHELHRTSVNFPKHGMQPLLIALLYPAISRWGTGYSTEQFQTYVYVYVCARNNFTDYTISRKI